MYRESPKNGEFYRIVIELNLKPQLWKNWTQNIDVFIFQHLTFSHILFLLLLTNEQRWLTRGEYIFFQLFYLCFFSL